MHHRIPFAWQKMVPRCRTKIDLQRLIKRVSHNLYYVFLFLGYAWYDIEDNVILSLGVGKENFEIFMSSLFVCVKLDCYVFCVCFVCCVVCCLDELHKSMMRLGLLWYYLWKMLNIASSLFWLIRFWLRFVEWFNHHFHSFGMFRFILCG